MVGRLIIRPARILLSSPGVPVSEGMADSGKIFDSDWNWSGILLESGGLSDPGGGDWHMMFKRNYGYRPCVVGRMHVGAPYAIPWSGPMVTSPMMDLGPQNVCPFVYPDRIVFPRNFTGGGSFNYGYIEYEAYGVD